MRHSTRQTLITSRARALTLASVLIGTLVGWPLSGLATPGNLFVSSGFSNSVLEYNGTTGAFVTTFASGGGLSHPEGLTFGPNGPTMTPEPASLWLLGSGLAGLAGWRQWRRMKQA